jgi:hypothetical protein
MRLWIGNAAVGICLQVPNPLFADTRCNVEGLETLFPPPIRFFLDTDEE